MKQFTCTEEVLKHFDPQDERLIVLHENDVMTLRDDIVELFCHSGWGTADGVTTGKRTPGVVKLDLEDSLQDISSGMLDNPAE